MRKHLRRVIFGCFSSVHNIIIAIFFSLLFLGLFLGDGKQAVVDIYGAALVLVIASLYITKTKPRRHIHDSVLFLWESFLCWLCVSAVFSIDFGYSFYGIIRFVEAFLIYYVFYVYFPTSKLRFFVWLLMLFGGGALFFAMVYGFYPELRSIPSMNLLWSNAGHNHITDVLLIILIPALFLFGINARRFIVISTMFILAFVYFKARAMAAIAMLSIAIAHEIIGKQSRAFVRVRTYIFLVAVLALTVLFIVPEIGPSLPWGKNHIKTSISSDRRFAYWQQAFVALKERPVFGGGPGTFALLSKKHQQFTGESSWFAHNFLLEIMAESGLPGGVMFLVILYISFVKPAYSLINKTKLRERLALQFSSMALIIYSLVDFSLNYLVIWIIMWAMIGISTQYE